MNFLPFLLQRLVKALSVLLGVVVLNFFLIHLAPGDPVRILAGEAGAADEGFVHQLRQQFGLDKPLPVQLGQYLLGIARLDLGLSYRSRLPVLELILDRLPATLLLMSGAFVFSLVTGVLLGSIAARARYEGRRGWLDSLLMSASLLIYGTPLFWLSLMAIILFSIVLGWLPAFGMESVGANLRGLDRALDIAWHMVLPTLSLGLWFMAVYVRLTRAAMLEVIGMDFVKTARAKGVPPGRVIRVHVLRNALLPVITFAGIQVGQIGGGALLTETVFAWPGIGRLMFDALLQRDYQLLLGTFLMTSVIVVAFNLLTEIVYRLVDPRIAAGQEARG